jgi:Family of unknown function (DUF6328)
MPTAERVGPLCDVQPALVEVVVLSTNGKERNSGDPQSNPLGDPLGDPKTAEDRNEKLNRELIELLNELKVAIPGVQVLFAFLLVVPFSPGFSSVSTLLRYVYFATMLCTAISGVLLLAPSSHHRLLWRRDQREERLKMGNRLAVGGDGLPRPGDTRRHLLDKRRRVRKRNGSGCHLRHRGVVRVVLVRAAAAAAAPR